MFLPWALPVTVERDLWDRYLYAASLCAAITAIVLFLPWALERRRRPEVRIDWALSLDGDPAKLEDWPADYIPQIIPGQAICVRVAVHNVGDRASEAALTNFVVPACFDLRRYSDLEAKPEFSGNPTAGLPPDYRVAYFALGLEPWAPGNSFIYPCQLTCLTSRNQDEPLRTRLLVRHCRQPFQPQRATLAAEPSSAARTRPRARRRAMATAITAATTPAGSGSTPRSGGLYSRQP
jgi:hypothetical protein